LVVDSWVKESTRRGREAAAFRDLRDRNLR
jgi:hypothetical protein